jgi:serine/threonine protein phosphatase 1
MLIIGDIHGCHAELLDLLDRAAIADDEEIVSVGDMVDRGPEPAAVLDFFQTRARARAIMGNHERKHVRAVFSYGQEITREQLGDRYPSDVAWMAGLPYHLETPEVRVVHFGHFPGVALPEVPEDVRAGTTSGEQRLRERYPHAPWYELYEDDIPIVFGHAVVGPEPLVVRDKIFGIDTGACHGMRLTGIVVPELRIVSVPAREDHWKRVRAAFQAPVLRRRAWPSMTFEQIERKLKSLRGTELGDVVLARIAAWVTTLRDAIPLLRARLDEELARLIAEGPTAALSRMRNTRGIKTSSKQKRQLPKWGLPLSLADAKAIRHAAAAKVTRSPASVGRRRCSRPCAFPPSLSLCPRRSE